MKKLFALTLVVAMLSVASIASATTITATPTTVTVQRGSTATVTVTGTATHRGTLTYGVGGTAAAWATLSGTTLTLSPASTLDAGAYRAIVTVTETYNASDDVAGHSRTVERTDTASATVVVNVTAPVTPKTDGGSEVASSTRVIVEVVVTRVIRNVKVVSAARAVVVTPAAMTTPSARRTVVQQTVNALVAALRAISSFIPATGVVVRESTNVTVIESPNYDASDTTAARESNLRKAAARLMERAGANSRKRAIGVVPPIIVAQAGLQPFDLPRFDSAYFGKKPGFDLGKRATGTTAGSFYGAAADGSNEAVFLDSTGASTDVIPGGGYGNTSADPGVLTVVVYVEANTVYEPIVFTEVASADEAAFDAATGTTTVASVDIADVTEEEVTVNTTATFSPVVDYEAIIGVGKAYGKSLDLLPLTAASTTASWSPSSADTAYMTANKLQYVCFLPVLTVSEDKAYIAQITFDHTPTGTSLSKPMFYADGVSAGGLALSAVYLEAGSGYTEITDGTAIQNGLVAYLVFEVSNGAVVKLLQSSEFDAAAVTTLTKPALVVQDTTTVADAEISRLQTAGYISSSNVLLDAAYLNGTKPAFTTSGDLYIMNVELKSDFTVDTWAATVGGTALTVNSSAITGTITKTSNTSARVQVSKSSLPSGNSAVVLTLHPAAAQTGNNVTASGWTVAGSTTPTDPGVGNSSGGCSAGSAVLAMAVLGAFIATRKK